MKCNRLVNTTSILKMSPSGGDQFSPMPHIIAVLAYRLWTERGRPIGSPEEDWLAAEHEIMHHRTPGSAM
jgi:Protein of unknown function (DUF2934)